MGAGERKGLNFDVSAPATIDHDKSTAEARIASFGLLVFIPVLLNPDKGYIGKSSGILSLSAWLTLHHTVFAGDKGESDGQGCS